MEIKEILELKLFDNTILTYLYFLVGYLILIPLSSYFLKLSLKFFSKVNNQNDTDKFNSLLKKPIKYFLFLVVLYVSSMFLDLSELIINKESGLGIIDIISKAFNFLLLLIVFWIINRSIDFIGFKLKNRASETESKVDDQVIPFAVDMAKVITIVLGIVMILGNVFDVNIAALVTGLGIGGVAFALASKESLENLLGSFTIFFDKPFTVGDIVTLGGVTGVVEKVGFRSTRIRTFDKSIVTVPNKNIISSELDNLGARPVRRVKFNIGLTYDSSVNNIKAIVNDIQDLIDKHPDTFSGDDDIVGSFLSTSKK